MYKVTSVTPPDGSVEFEPLVDVVAELEHPASSIVTAVALSNRVM
jgi:hypothetical protein